MLLFEEEVVGEIVIKSLNVMLSSSCKVRSGIFASNTTGQPMLSRTSSPIFSGDASPICLNS